MNSKRAFLIVGAVLVGAILIQFFAPRPESTPAPVFTATTTSQTTQPSQTPLTDVQVTSVATKKVPARVLTLAEGDTIVSWVYPSAYRGTPELETRAREEIARLITLLQSATSSEMIIAVGIANQYELLGEGKEQFEYLKRATSVDTTSGLPWHNAGVLMERLGALRTAQLAYEQATLIQSQLPTYHYAYIEFLLSAMKGDTARIEKAFANAEKGIGKAVELEALRAEWMHG